jgi:hypothetical protein
MVHRHQDTTAAETGEAEKTATLSFGSYRQASEVDRIAAIMQTMQNAHDENET